MMNSIEQKIYTQLLKDEKLVCTCDDMIREQSIFQARGLYHSCMLYQVTRAIFMTILKMETKK